MKVPDRLRGPIIGLDRWMLELTLVFAVIVIVTVLLLPSAQTVVQKARLTQGFVYFVGDRVDVVEEIALTGTVRTASVPVNVHDDQSPDPVTKDAKNKVEMFRHLATLTAAGTLQGEPGRPYRLAFSPALRTDGSGATVQWFCGNRTPPADWAFVAGQPETQLPASLEFSVCKALPPEASPQS